MLSIFDAIERELWEGSYAAQPDAVEREPQEGSYAMPSIFDVVEREPRKEATLCYLS